MPKTGHRARSRRATPLRAFATLAAFRRTRTFRACVWTYLILLFAATSPVPVAHADGGFAYSPWNYVSTAGNNPLPWVGTCNAPPLNCGIGAPATQNIMDLHCNWHCTKANPFFCAELPNVPSSAFACNGSNATEDAWGNDFVAFHRQLLLDYELWRKSLAGPRIQPFDAEPTGVIPGDDENTTSNFTKCSTGPANAITRSAGVLCTTCDPLPSCMQGDANLALFSNIGAIGSEMMCSNYHNQGHIGIANARNTSITNCGDFFSFRFALRDPAFWASHQHIDDVARDWQRLQAADVAIVIDQSGSMNDNCPAGSNGDCAPSDITATPCKLSDARNAAKMFADLLQDDRPGSTDEHRLGLVAFSNAAVTAMGLSPAAGIVGDPSNQNDSAFDTALNNLTACGGTGIGRALEVADSLVHVGTNPHKAILLLTDGLENIAPMIADVEDAIGPEVIVCAIGYGTDWADNEDALRTLCEDHGGVFIADPDLSVSGITLQKFFVDCFGQIYDSAISEDPLDVIPANLASSAPIPMTVCGSDSKLSVVDGYDFSGAFASIDLSLLVTTPGNNLVRVPDAGVEAGNGRNWDFEHIALPYRGEGAGTWTAQILRPQRVYTNEFTTDAYVDRTAGKNLVRTEIHRLFPRGMSSVLYYEDGNLAGWSSYKDALDAEVAAGAIAGYTTATSAADFNTKLAQNWDLIVFARQLNPAAQVYDAALQNKICGGQQKAILTDFYLPATTANPILACAGVAIATGGASNYTTLTGDGRLLVGTLTLTNRGYPTFFSRTLTITQTREYWIVQASAGTAGNAIVGNGSTRGAQQFFYSVLTRGDGRIDPSPQYPRYMVGQTLKASFRMGRTYVPAGGWDAVTATVTLDRPGAGALETYTLYDDGTHGDKIAGNHVWEVDVPAAAAAAGPHKFTASFLLTKNGCTVQRQAEYSTVVTGTDFTCKPHIACPPNYTGGPGEAVALGVCWYNNCGSARSYTVTVSDTKGWLCAIDSLGNRTPYPTGISLASPTLAPLGSLCVSQMRDLYLCIPTGVAEGESTQVIVTITPSNGQGMTCARTIKGTRAITSTEEPPLPSHMTIKGMWDPNLRSARFYASMPAQGRTVLRVFDLSGRLVATPVDRVLGAGLHTFRWDGFVNGSQQRAASGFYIYRLTVGREEAAGSLIIAR